MTLLSKYSILFLLSLALSYAFEADRRTRTCVPFDVLGKMTALPIRQSYTPKTVGIAERLGSEASFEHP